MFIDTKVRVEGGFTMISIQRGEGGEGLQRNIWKSSELTSTIFKHAGTGKQGSSWNVFASFPCTCVRVRGGEGVKGLGVEGWLPQLDFNFRASCRVRNERNETIRMKFSAPKTTNGLEWNF